MEQHTDYSQENNLETFTIFKFPSEEIFNSVASSVDVNILNNIRHQGLAYKPCDNCPNEILEGYWVVLLNNLDGFPSELKQYEYNPTGGIAFKIT